MGQAGGREVRRAGMCAGILMQWTELGSCPHLLRGPGLSPDVERVRLG